MSFASQIIDQHVQALSKEHRAEFEDNLGIKGGKIKSAAFVLLAVKTYFDISNEEALDRITEGGNDFGVDAIHYTEEIDGEFTVTLFQGKYKQKLNAGAKFPRTGVEKMLLAVQTLLDPDQKVCLNDRLRVRIEAIRSIVRDGAIPRVQVVLCNNGEKWDDQGQELIDNAQLGDQVSWSHANHDSIINILRAPKEVDEALQLTGKAHFESFSGYRRVLVGRVSVSEIAQLFEKHGDRLLERNIRRYLGLHGSRVNRGIEATLLDERDSANFYFYNNGITIICDQVRVNQLQSDNWKLRLSKMQVINGGQTCQTIKTVLLSEREAAADATVMVRIYELPSDDREFVQAITYATNSQNPVDLRDLKSNDSIQKDLEVSLDKLGYTYRRQRSENPSTSNIVTSKVAAEATLAVWRQRPHQAKFRTTEHFGTLYDTIFTKNLNGAQVVLAVLLLRIAENKRKRPPKDAALFLQYASCFLAMEMGAQLLQALERKIGDIDHRYFPEARELLEANAEKYYQRAVRRIEKALHRLHGNDLDQVSLQRLAATFRRSDLIEELRSIDTRKKNSSKRAPAKAAPAKTVAKRPDKKKAAKKAAKKASTKRTPRVEAAATKTKTTSATKKTSTKRVSATKTAAKKASATTKTSTKRTTTKQTVKKKPKKKTSAKRTTTKQTVKKKPKKKTSAKRASAAKTSVKKASATKRTSTKRATTKQTAKKRASR